MSLTGTHHAFASIDEHGVNIVLHSFFATRPHYLHYGSTPFVVANSVADTQVPPIAFPGVPGGISYAIDLEIPTVDLFPANGPLPGGLVIGADQLSISTQAKITLGCIAGQGADRKGNVHPTQTDLKVVAIGHPLSAFLSPGVGWISFQIDQVVVEDVKPPSLQAVLDCLLEMILNAILSKVELPFSIMDVDFFKLSLEEGPTVIDNQIKIWGDVS